METTVKPARVPLGQLTPAQREKIRQQVMRNESKDDKVPVAAFQSFVG